MNDGHVMKEAGVLLKMPLFVGLSELQLKHVIEAGRTVKFPVGTVIIKEGEASDSLFILMRGSVEITKHLGRAIGIQMDESKQKTLVKIAAPAFFGEMGLLEEAERSATITAATACELVEVTKADFDRVAQEDLELGYHLARNVAMVLSSRLRNTDKDVIKLTLALSLALGNR
jgi:CRP/FNR family cyclic AMP-dependent transcriptional regulator